jgi:opacity protein-like surface antigen
VPLLDGEWPLAVDIALESDPRAGPDGAAPPDTLPDSRPRKPRFGKALVPAFALSAFALCPAAPAHSETASQDNATWEFEAAPYLWVAATDVSTRLGARAPVVNANGSVSGDISSSMNAGAMGTFEARRGRWGVLLDLWRVTASNGAKPVMGGVLGNARLKTTQAAAEFAGAYRVWNHQTTPVDAVAGLRYSYLKADISLSPSLVLPAGARFTDSVDWPDAFVGVRVAHALTDKWRLVGYADIGAGVTKKSWQALAGANYAISDNMSAKFGYRVFNMDFEKSYSISDIRADFRLSMKTSGVYAGLGYRF